jgi:hypothetical protein
MRFDYSLSPNARMVSHDAWRTDGSECGSGSATACSNAFCFWQRYTNFLRGGSFLNRSWNIMKIIAVVRSNSGWNAIYMQIWTDEIKPSRKNVCDDAAIQGANQDILQRLRCRIGIQKKFNKTSDSTYGLFPVLWHHLYLPVNFGFFIKEPLHRYDDHNPAGDQYSCP